MRAEWYKICDDMMNSITFMFPHQLKTSSVVMLHLFCDSSSAYSIEHFRVSNEHLNIYSYILHIFGCHTHKYVITFMLHSCS